MGSFSQIFSSLVPFCSQTSCSFVQRDAEWVPSYPKATFVKESVNLYVFSRSLLFPAIRCFVELVLWAGSEVCQYYPLNVPFVMKCAHGNVCLFVSNVLKASCCFILIVLPLQCGCT